MSDPNEEIEVSGSAEEMRNFINDIVKESMQLQEEKDKKRPTKEEIMAVKNRRERQKLIQENMDLFK